MIAIADSAPLIAAINRRDPDHARCAAVLRRIDLEIFIPSMIVAEVCYYLGDRFNASVEATFLRGLQSMRIASPIGEDWALIANLVERYSDFPLGGTDASVAVLAERLGTDVIVTLDRRHFGALRMSDGRPFTLLPE